jgi:hypothetical protein
MKPKSRRSLGRRFLCVDGYIVHARRERQHCWSECCWRNDMRSCETQGGNDEFAQPTLGYRTNTRISPIKTDFLSPRSHLFTATQV